MKILVVAPPQLLSKDREFEDLFTGLMLTPEDPEFMVGVAGI